MKEKVKVKEEEGEGGGGRGEGEGEGGRGGEVYKCVHGEKPVIHVHIQVHHVYSCTVYMANSSFLTL